MREGGGRGGQVGAGGGVLRPGSRRSPLSRPGAGLGGLRETRPAGGAAVRGAGPDPAVRRAGAGGPGGPGPAEEEGVAALTGGQSAGLPPSHRPGGPGGFAD